MKIIFVFCSYLRVNFSDDKSVGRYSGISSELGKNDQRLITLKFVLNLLKPNDIY